MIVAGFVVAGFVVAETREFRSFLSLTKRILVDYNLFCGTDFPVFLLTTAPAASL